MSFIELNVIVAAPKHLLFNYIVEAEFLIELLETNRTMKDLEAVKDLQ